MDSLYIRNTYLKKVEPYIGKEIIKVLTGQRRVGKTILLKQIQYLVQQLDKKANTIYVNKEQHEFKQIKNADDLFEYVETQLKPKQSNYVFIDEIQEIQDFEIALRQLLVKGVDIYCTGSNANMLSGDLATHLSGRYIEFHINSLSYTEFMEMHQLPNNNDTLNKYIRYGGLPYLVNLPLSDEIVYGYLKSIYNTIILKDIVARYNIRDVDFLDRLVEYLSDNLGSYVSSNKISDFLKSQRVHLSVNTVMNYLKYLSSSFFIILNRKIEIT